MGKALASVDGVFDWIFLDPPYQGGALDRALRLLGSTRLVAGIAVAEHDVKNPPAERFGRIELSSRRVWGATAVSFYRPTADLPTAHLPTADLPTAQTGDPKP